MARAELHSARSVSNRLNGHARLACIECGTPPAPDRLFGGCEVCAEQPPLELIFEVLPHSRPALREAVAYARRNLSPLAGGQLANLGAVVTPLTPVTRLGAGVYLKNEIFSPTGSHKDRYHAVAAGAARLLSCAGIVTTSTGNHGASAAAFAASANLPSVVLCHANAPEALLRAIQAYGGVPAQLADDDARSMVAGLVARGWFPATSMDPALSGAGNPYCAEGYKEIAYEAIEQLGRMPATVIVPTAGGDTLYGIAKGLLEISALTGSPLPKLVAVQPLRANTLSRSAAAGRPVTLESADSIALSLSDRRVGRQALVALRRTNGVAIDVEESEIATAVRDLALAGFWTEPASAAGLAGYRVASRDDLIDASGPTVIVLTASGFKWPDAMARVVELDSVRSRAELWHRLDLLASGESRADGH